MAVSSLGGSNNIDPRTIESRNTSVATDTPDANPVDLVGNSTSTGELSSNAVRSAGTAPSPGIDQAAAERLADLNAQSKELKAQIADAQAAIDAETPDTPEDVKQSNAHKMGNLEQRLCDVDDQRHSLVTQFNTAMSGGSAVSMPTPTAQAPGAPQIGNITAAPQAAGTQPQGAPQTVGAGIPPPPGLGPNDDPNGGGGPNGPPPPNGGGPGPNGPGPGGPPNQGPGASSFTDGATRQAAIQADMQQASTIYSQMAADRQKSWMRNWQIMQDLQTTIIEMLQGVAQRRAAAANKAAEAWCQVIRGQG